MRALLDNTDLDDEMQKAIEPVLDALNDFIAPDDEPETVTITVGDTPIVVKTGEEVEKHRGVARKRFQRLEAALKSLREMFELFSPEEVEEVTKEATTTEEDDKNMATKEETTAAATTEEVVDAAVEKVETTTEATTTEDAVTAETTETTTVAAVEEADALAKVVEGLVAKIDELTKSIEESKEETANRLEAVEKARGIKRSLEGQEGEVTKSAGWGLFPGGASVAR